MSALAGVLLIGAMSTPQTLMHYERYPGVPTICAESRDDRSVVLPGDGKPYRWVADPRGRLTREDREPETCRSVRPPKIDMPMVRALKTVRRQDVTGLSVFQAGTCQVAMWVLKDGEALQMRAAVIETGAQVPEGEPVSPGEGRRLMAGPFVAEMPQGAAAVWLEQRIGGGDLITLHSIEFDCPN